MGVILLGALLLMLPISVKDGHGATFENALFTSTSAVCVTGLVVKDTASYWTGFGQAVILILIQIGGLGVITVAAFIAMISGRKISLLQRSMLQDSISADQIGGLVKMTRFIFKVALISEAIGALLMLPTFCGKFGLSGIWDAVFHSVSAFCNAGFDIMGERTGHFSSLTSFASNPGIVIRMQSKVVLIMTGVLIIVPTLLLFVYEYTGKSLTDRFLLSLFQAVTPRTAGFNTASLSSLSGAGTMLMIALMLIGGSPGSTAGGMKTTTLAVLAANASSVFRRKKSVQLFGRRVDDSMVRHAATLFMMYLTLPAIAAAVISIVEKIPVGTCLFETASAIGTVGLSKGITPDLGLLSHSILIVLMFLGRVGGLTLIYAAVNVNSSEVSHRPVGKINVG